MSDPDALHTVTLDINGTRKTVAVEARRLLVQLIQEDLGFAGTLWVAIPRSAEASQMLSESAERPSDRYASAESRANLIRTEATRALLALSP